MAGAAIGVIAISPPLSAQDAQTPPEQIDILAPQQDYLGPLEDCSAEQEAASISGEIVVCRRRRDNGEFAVDEDGSAQLGRGMGGLGGGAVHPGLPRAI